MPPQDVLAGALELAASYRYFPAGTVFLVVVDPGVGTPRRAIAVEAGDFRFVAPDNGVLTIALREESATRSRGTDRPEVRASNREPDVRGARPLRAGGSLARERY